VPPRDPHTSVSLVSFSHRPRSTGSTFYDYSARYGAVREEDRITLRQSMFPSNSHQPLLHESHPRKPTLDLFSSLADKLKLTELLDLPLVALSNGQTRRARILKALLAQPQLLLLDEPLSTFVCHLR
jgi:ABC-type molybdenum transport system ATPase subunit/photorepair protein PhrA